MQTKTIRTLTTLAALAVFMYGCGNGRVNSVESRSVLLPLTELKMPNYHIVLLNGSGNLKQGDNSIILQFHRLSDDALVDVQDVKVSNVMAGGAAAGAETTVTSPAMPGYYVVDVKYPQAGKWNMNVNFAGNQHTAIPLDVN